MNNIKARPNSLKRRHALILVLALVLVSAIVATPIFSARAGLFRRGANNGSVNLPETARTKAMANRSSKLPSLFSTRGSQPAQDPETIATYAADCTTPKTVFTLGETVCAKTNGVNLSYPGGRWVDWILTETNPYTFEHGSRTTTLITTNPQTFSYAPTATGFYKVEITEDDGNGGDNPQLPATIQVLPVAAVPLATYASNCTTPQTAFNLGQTVCIRVAGLSNVEFPARRVEVIQPDGFVLQSFNVNDNSNQFSYTIPATNTDTFADETIQHRGTWVIAVIDRDSEVRKAVPITVHKTNLLVDRVADLQLMKYVQPGDPPPDAGTLISFQIFIINQGPDAATNPHLADVTLPNTSFVSFVRNTFVSSNMIPYRNSGSFLADDTLDTDFVRFIRDSSPWSHMTFRHTSLSPFLGDSSLTFNCTSPSPGSAGTTNCTTSGELAPGETASFTAVYRVSSNVATGAELSDNFSATVGSDTVDQFSGGNSQPATATTSSSNPAPACSFTCPDNITVGTNALNGNQRGAIVTFGPEASGNCGTGITSQPASGSFFAAGTTTPVTSQTGSGASCSFNVTVVDTPQPTISCAADQSGVAPSGASEVAVSVPAPAYTGQSAIVGDVHYPLLTGTRSDQRELSDPYPIGKTTITWNVSDQYGTTKSCVQKVVVTSVDAPTISCPLDKTFTASSGCERIVTAAEIGAPITGGAASASNEPCPLSNPCAVRSDHLALDQPFPAGQTAITWTATNNLGTVACTQIITIKTAPGTDTTPPVLTIPPDINISTAECSVVLDDELGIAEATDNCTSAITIQRTGVPLIACALPDVCSIPCPTQSDPGRTCNESFIFPTGLTDITYTATDAAGNTATAVQHINIAENPVVFPTITAPNNLVVNTLPTDTGCGTLIGDATLGSATASDNCPGVTIARTGVPAGNVFPVGDTYITYTATDRTNHSTPATQKVTVVDKTPPVFTSVPPAVVAYTGLGATTCDTVVSDTILGTAAATDNCGTVTVTRSPSGNTFPVGTTTITWTATDGANPANTTTATQTVTVIDNTVPVITVNGSMPSMWPPNHKYQTFQLTGFVTGASDNCGGVGINDVVIEKVTSDETENGNGDGNTNNDIIIAANCKSVQLRSERDGGGNGRVYTITFKVTDTHGNVGRATARVVVPHNPGETPIDSGVHYTVNGTCP